jgi:hypothetical protein
MALRSTFTRLFFTLVLVLCAVMVPVSTALAKPPVKSEYAWPQVNTLSGVCSFDITVTSAVMVTETDFFDDDGNLTMIHMYGDEQDTFTANGKTLVGLPFENRVRLYFDSDGNLTQIIGTGIIEKIQLPDGSLFVSAGRVDFLAHPGSTYVLSPDKGNSGNIAEFCAALAP